MSKLVLLAMLMALAGCSGTGEQKSLLQTLEFDEDECGCFRSNINIAPTMFTGTSMNAILHKAKACGEGEEPPTC